LGDQPADRAELVATLTEPPSDDGRELTALAGVASWLEVRADLAGELGPEALRRHFPGGLVYTLRSRAEGGRGENDPARRAARLAAAARAGYDLVDLEGERDGSPDLLAAVPAERRLVSWHGGVSDFAALEACFERLAAIPARLYKMVPAARQPGDELPPLVLLHSLRRADLVAFASGPSGAWTRLVAPRLGAPWVYGSAGADPAAPGQPTVAALAADYGLPALPPVERVFGVVGHPVSGSLSPRLHNGAYRALGVPALYLAFDTPAFGDFWLEVVETGVLGELGLPLVGLSITAPYKRVALAVAGAASPRVELLGAVNTLVRTGAVWEAESTDPEGVTGPLAARGVSVAGRRAAVVGSGGAGRAAAFALDRAGAEVTLVNRGAERGREAAERLELPYLPLDRFRPGDWQVVVNATPLGREPGDEPFDYGRLAEGVVAIDLVYGERPTPLLAAAAARGGVGIDGREVLLYQAIEQFRWMVGGELPAGLGRRLLGLEEGPEPE
jgi:3-dehydroquinate dehydratase/shikimate dehydrogenase